MEQQLFKTHRLLGEQLIRDYPEEYGGQNPYRLGKNYEERNPDLVKVTGDVEFESDFFQTAGELFEGAVDLGEGVLGDVKSLAKSSFNTPASIQRMAQGKEDLPLPFLRSLAKLGRGTLSAGFERSAEAMGLPKEVLDKVEYQSSPQELQAGRDLIDQVQEELEPYEMKRRPFRSLATAASVTPGGALAKGAVRAGVPAKRVAQAQTALRYANPENLLSTSYDAAKGVKDFGVSGAKKTSDFLSKFTKGSVNKGESLLNEMAKTAAAFTTSTSREAVDALIKSIQEGPKSRELIRKWRNTPRKELYENLAKSFTKGVKKVRQNAQDAYASAEKKLAPVLNRPMSAVEPTSVALMQQKIEKLISGKGGTFQPKEGELITVVGADGIIRNVREPGSMEVSFSDATIIPETTGLKKVIAKEFEKYLKVDENKFTGLDLHRMRKELDKTIQNLPTSGKTDDVYKPAFKMLSNLRKILSDTLEGTYGDEYRSMMKPYRDAIEIQESMFDSFNILGIENLDRNKIESISGELANTFNDNPRQAQRPFRIAQLAQATDNPELYLAVVGATFEPFLSKGLAQRAVFASTAGVVGGALTGDVTFGALSLLAGAAGGQVLYSPRLFSNTMMNLYDIDFSLDKAKRITDSIKSNAKATKILADDASPLVTLERLKNEAGIDLDAMIAEEIGGGITPRSKLFEPTTQEENMRQRYESLRRADRGTSPLRMNLYDSLYKTGPTQEQSQNRSSSLLRSLSRAGTPNPSR